MSDEPIMGSIALTAFSYAPKNTAFCNGQPIAIAQNQALFALLGVTYGGDGRTTFNLPDLRGRMPVGAFASADTGYQHTPYSMGETGGLEQVTLTVGQIPSHGHGDVTASGRQGTTTSPSGAYLAAGDALRFAPGTDLQTAMVSTVGGSQPHDNRQPTSVLNWVIYLYGIFPSRQ